jgi:class 3 adenylate cyclase/tetratricopeptide (TPR) repeat protein
MTCRGCGTENRSGRRFCVQCGAALEVRCSACGATGDSGDRFCGECGHAVADGVASGQPSAPVSTTPAGSERRLVSVLFADLVGFTSLSEHRDPEEVRDLLSRYFDRCRSLIERYGGVVEKFIGDAVMAVWGTPVAREDDPERAVRAALSLNQAIVSLGDEVGMPELRVRAGVLTGNAAVDLGAKGEGMVLGDTVNTASRLQALAPPGTVLVDEVTRRASEAAITFEDAGMHQLKGREQPVHAWTALRVVAGVGGVRRSAGLEVPFVGRTKELEDVISASDEVAASGRACLVAVVGGAGSGKSRLLWEYYKYVDGVENVVRWHQGRCLSYGEGVGYWALAEMVRARAGIVEEEDSETARAKLRATVNEYVTDERERRLVEPRLAHLLGLGQRTASDRADLFSGWRLFFERLAENAPVILAFEDLQWADSGLLDFIDYLLEWSAEHPLFVLALGRPELLEERPAWGSLAVSLGALPDAAMREALAGLVPGLSEELTARILRQAEGVPLYAVETVRMLLDRGLLAQDGSRYVVTGDVGELDVPETLHALAAARLDGLTALERAVLQDASVYGQSFTPAGVAAIGAGTLEEVRHILDGLVAKQVLGYNDDPLSAERGQFQFLQALLRTTAYGTLSRRDRKSRHLAVARHLQEAWGSAAPELAEVLAAHFLDAADAEPDAADAPRIRAAACETLAEAGQRALSLALGPEAQRAFDRAAELAGDDGARAALLDQAGRAALLNDDHAAARERLGQAITLFEALGDRESVARSLATMARVLHMEDRLDEAIELDQRAVAGLPEGGADKAAALAALARNLAFRGDAAEALEAADAALAIAEPLQEWRTVLAGFNTIGVVRARQGRIEESVAFFQRSLALSLEHDVTEEALRTYNNLADVPLQLDRFADALDFAQRGLALAKSRGDRHWETWFDLMIATASVGLGRWDSLPELDDDGLPRTSGLLRLAYLPLLARVQAARGDVGALQCTLGLANEEEGSTNTEFATGPIVARAIALRGLGQNLQALEVALPIATGGPAIPNEDLREAYAEAGLAALAIGDEATVERLVAFVSELPSAMRSPLLRAGAARFAGLLAWRHGEPEIAVERFAAGTRELREVGAQFNLAQLLLEHAEVLIGVGRENEAEPLLGEARATFERLAAAPWLERADALQRAGAAA